MVILDSGERECKQVVGGFLLDFFTFQDVWLVLESFHVKSLLSVITKHYDFILVPRDSKCLKGIVKAHLFILRPTSGHDDIIA